MHKGVAFFLLLLKRSISYSKPVTSRNPNFSILGFRPRCHFVSDSVSGRRWLTSSSQSAAVLAEPRTSDGMTVDAIVAKGWPILDEGDGDWKSHAAAIAQSIQLIKKRLQVTIDPFLFLGVDWVIDLEKWMFNI